MSSCRNPLGSPLLHAADRSPATRERRFRTVVRRCFWSFATVAVLLTAPSWSSAAPRPPGRNVAPQIALAKPAKLELVDVPIGELAGRLSEQFLLPVYLDVGALKKAEIASDKKLSLTAQYKSLEEGLTALAEAAGLAWLVRGELLVLTSPEQASEVLETRVYQLAQPAQPMDYDILIESLVKVSPKSWAEEGGIGTPRQLAPDLLIVFQTRRVQNQLGSQFAATMRSVDHVEVKNPKPAWPAQTRALARPVSCDFDQKPLSEAIVALAREAKLPLALDEKDLNDAGIEITTPVSLRLRGVKLSTVLSLLLESLELTYVPAKQGLRITSIVQAETEASSVLYPVVDLVTDGSGEELIRLITGTIEPTSWSDVGGVGKLRLQADQGMLEMSQYFDVHRQLEQLLADIRAARGR